MEYPVPQAEDRSIAPAEQEPGLVFLAIGYVRQMEYRHDDLARYERIVVVERSGVSRAANVSRSSPGFATTRAGISRPRWWSSGSVGDRACTDA